MLCGATLCGGGAVDCVGTYNSSQGFLHAFDYSVFGCCRSLFGDVCASEGGKEGGSEEGFIVLVTGEATGEITGEVLPFPVDQPLRDGRRIIDTRFQLGVLRDCVERDYFFLCVFFNILSVRAVHTAVRLLILYLRDLTLGLSLKSVFGVGYEPKEE